MTVPEQTRSDTPPRLAISEHVPAIAGMGALSAVVALPTPPSPGVPQRRMMHEAGGLSAVGPMRGPLGVPFAMPVGCTVGYSG